MVCAWYAYNRHSRTADQFCGMRAEYFCDSARSTGTDADIGTTVPAGIIRDASNYIDIGY